MENLKDLRYFVKRLEQVGQLAYVEREVDPKHEIAALLVRSGLDDGPALFFKNVKGFQIPVVGNVAGSRQKLALALEAATPGVQDVYRERIEKPLPVEVTNNGPCQEVVTEDIELDSLPVITAHEHDAGPYITAGVVVAKHPQTGVRNISLHRICPRGKDKAGIHIGLASDLLAYLKASTSSLPVAVAIGLHPAFLLAASVKFPITVDEFTVVGSLRQQPVQLVKCKTVEAEVPATAEVVLEGEIPRDVRDWEGPFGEYPGYYGAGTLKPGLEPIINLKAMTTRKDPIYQTTITGPTPGYESSHFSCLAKEGAVFSAAKGVCPWVRAVNVILSRNIGVIQLERGCRSGDIGLIMAAAFSSMSHFKYVIVVDTDVNIDSYADVLWALSTRVDPSKEIYIFNDQPAPGLDPSTRGMCNKIGIDATVPQGREQGFLRTRIPGFEKVKLQDYLSARSS